MSGIEQRMRDAILAALADGATTTEQIGDAMWTIADAMTPPLGVTNFEATPAGQINVRLEYQPGRLPGIT